MKNDWLRLKIAGKEEAKIRETLDKRYANYQDRLRQLNTEDVFQTFMNSYAMAIEPHTNYLGPRARDNFDIGFPVTDCTNAIVCAIRRSRSLFHIMSHLGPWASDQRAIRQSSDTEPSSTCKVVIEPTDRALKVSGSCDGAVAGS